MEALHWPLTILTKAVHFKNLTGASSHVGLSQPQLSRLVSQLEKEFDVTLLDRSAKRKSAWTPAAFRLAEIYAQSSRKLQSSIQEAIVAQIPTQVNIGTLEGLSDLALETAHMLLENSKISGVELDVFDQNELEEKFFNGEIDLMFSSREPNKQKLKHVVEVGFQLLEDFNSNDTFAVYSPYEYGKLKKKPEQKILISNSLSIRRHWLNTYGGRGTLPSSVKKSRNREMTPVLIVGTELFNETLWKLIEAHAKKV